MLETKKRGYIVLKALFQNGSGICVLSDLKGDWSKTCTLQWKLHYIKPNNCLFFVPKASQAERLWKSMFRSIPWLSEHYQLGNTQAYSLYRLRVPLVRSVSWWEGQESSCHQLKGCQTSGFIVINKPFTSTSVHEHWCSNILNEPVQFLQKLCARRSLCPNSQNFQCPTSQDFTQTILSRLSCNEATSFTRTVMRVHSCGFAAFAVRPKNWSLNHVQNCRVQRMSFMWQFKF